MKARVCNTAYLSLKQIPVAFMTVFISHLDGSMLCKAISKSDGNMAPVIPLVLKPNIKQVKSIIHSKQIILYSSNLTNLNALLFFKTIQKALS